jgi:hypothetical protein
MRALLAIGDCATGLCDPVLERVDEVDGGVTFKPQQDLACPTCGTKQTSSMSAVMSATDPERTFLPTALKCSHSSEGNEGWSSGPDNLICLILALAGVLLRT